MSRTIRNLTPVVVAAVAVAVLPRLPFSDLVRPGTYQVDHVADAARVVASTVPSGVTVAASNDLAPLVVARDTTWLFPDGAGRTAAYVFVDTTRGQGVPASGAVQRAAFVALPADGYRMIDDDLGIELWTRQAP